MIENQSRILLFNILMSSASRASEPACKMFRRHKKVICAHILHIIINYKKNKVKKRYFVDIIVILTLILVKY